MTERDFNDAARFQELIKEYTLLKKQLSDECVIESIRYDDGSWSNIPSIVAFELKTAIRNLCVNHITHYQQCFDLLGKDKEK